MRRPISLPAVAFAMLVVASGAALALVRAPDNRDVPQGAAEHRHCYNRF